MACNCGNNKRDEAMDEILNKYIKDKDTVTSQNNIKKILDNMNEFGFNTSLFKF